MVSSMARDGRTWAAVDVDLDDDPEIVGMGWEGSMFWPRVLLRAKKLRSGRIPAAFLRPEYVSRVYRCPVDWAAQALGQIAASALVVVEPDGGWVVRGYDAWQTDPASNAERQAAWRARHKAKPAGADDPMPPSGGDDSGRGDASQGQSVTAHNETALRVTEGDNGNALVEVEVEVEGKGDPDHDPAPAGGQAPGLPGIAPSDPAPKPSARSKRSRRLTPAECGTDPLVEGTIFAELGTGSDLTWPQWIERLRESLPGWSDAEIRAEMQRSDLYWRGHLPDLQRRVGAGGTLQARFEKLARERAFAEAHGVAVQVGGGQRPFNPNRGITRQLPAPAEPAEESDYDPQAMIDELRADANLPGPAGDLARRMLAARGIKV